jgi:manganese oxidase
VPHMATLPGRVHDGSHRHDSEKNDAGMAGLVLGIRVTGTDAMEKPDGREARQFSLVVSEEPHRYGDRNGYRVDVEGLDAPRLDSGPVPGPVIVLTRGEPVAVTIRNRTSEPTAIHWHGIELDSYFDGVPGWGGRPGRIAPAVEPSGSFVARFAPPRAGTFIYHTHWHDDAQLAGGIYGPLIVLEPGQQFDPSTDHVLVVGLNGVLRANAREPFALNGRSTPAAIQLQAARVHRLRVINITASNVALTMFLTTPSGLGEWRVVAKDGADLAGPRAQQPARQLVSVGETYDFEVTPQPGQRLWFEVRRGNGEWVLQAPMIVR